MANFKTFLKTQINESVIVETFHLKKSDFAKLDVSSPKAGTGFLTTCSDPKLFHQLILMDDSEKKAKEIHESTVVMVQKSIKNNKT